MLIIQIDTKKLERVIYHQLNNIKLSFIASHSKSSFTLCTFNRCCTVIRYSRLVRLLKCTQLSAMLSFFKKAKLWLFPVFCSTPRGLEDVSQYPELFATLLASGMWTSEDLKKLAGLNFLRVFKEVERVSWSWGNDSSAALLYKNNIIKKPWLVVEAAAQPQKLRRLSFATNHSCRRGKNTRSRGSLFGIKGTESLHRHTHNTTLLYVLSPSSASASEASVASEAKVEETLIKYRVPQKNIFVHLYQQLLTSISGQ